MTETIHGLVSAVRAQTLGDVLSATATTADTVLNVNDVADFSEDGGWLTLSGLSFGGIQLFAQYTTVDDDAGTITLAPGVLPTSDGSPFPAGAEVYVWDNANGQPAVRYIATVDSVDGFDGDPVEAVVDQSLAHAFAQTMRDGIGESVTLVRDGSQLQVAQVHGRNNALASLQYLQGGMTTRLNDTDAGVDIVGSDSGTPGILAFAPGGDVTVRVDSATGDATFIGELGTANPGDPGIFMDSPTFSYKGSIVSQPTIQLNTGTTRDQPSIQADTAGSGAGITLFSGAGTAGRESHILADVGAISMGIERTANSSPDYGTTFELDDGEFFVGIHQGAGTGGSLLVQNAQMVLQSDYSFGTANLAAVCFGNTTSYVAGYRDNVTAAVQGMWLSRGGDTVIATKGAVDCQKDDASAFVIINASAFHVSSDSSLKTDFKEAPDALAILRAAPARQWRLKTDPKSTRRVGPMADDLPAWAVRTLAKDHKVAPGTKTISLDLQSGLHHRAIEQLLDRIEALEATVAALTEEG